MIRKKLGEFVGRRFLYPTTPELSSRVTGADTSGLKRIEESLKRNFFGAGAGDYLATKEGRRHLHGHLVGRLHDDRRRVVPWLNSAKPLTGSRILEIGCGTGSSTVALAEQGADVVAVDIVGKHMDVARERCDVYGLKPRFVEANATDVAEIFSGERFDFIIFFATLEHMTYEERLISMENSWNMLSPGALWVVVETPNRLHCFDDHTSLLPFFHWLPHDVAFDYGRFSPRASFTQFLSGKNRSNESILAFQRFGRSLSYHEFELAMAPLGELDVVSTLRTYTPGLRVLRRLQRRSLESQFQALLMKMCPHVHRAFLEPWLNIILRKS